MRSRNTLQAVLEGTLIGAAGLIPGASGGIMAVAFGVYQEALDAIIGLFSNFKKSFSFLWPYGLGVAIGVFGCAFALEWLLKNWNMPFMYMLIGMVLGGCRLRLPKNFVFPTICVLTSQNTDVRKFPCGNFLPLRV